MPATQDFLHQGLFYEKEQVTADYYEIWRYFRRLS